MTTLELTIDDLGAQGDGVAHYKNATLFVSGALAGERVRIEVEQTSNVVKRGTLLEVIKPSPMRETPPCPHFPKCGGCRFQHIKDEAYSQHKVLQLQHLLAKEKIKHPPFMPAVVTARATRRRARVAAKRTKTGVVIGFNEFRSKTIVNMQQCPVIVPELLSVIHELQKHLSRWLPAGQECDIQLTALDDGIDMVMIGGPPLDLNGRQNLADLAEALKIAHVSWRKWDRSPIEPIAHRTPLSIAFGGTKVPFPPASFLQATKAGEKALTDFTQAAYRSGTKALDLFCGLGTFGLSLENPEHVHFADLDGPAIESLEKAIKGKACYSVGMRNLLGDAMSAGEMSDYEFVIFDPPRGGAKHQAMQIAKSDVPSVVAISCDPQSFARDAKILIDGGYVIKAIQPVDQFLWSTHMEVAAHFVK